MKKLNLLTKSIVLAAFAFTLAVQPVRAEKKAAASINYQNLEAQFTADELKDLASAARESGNKAYLAAILAGLRTYESGRFDIRLELGETYIALNRHAEAIPVLKEASALIPSDEAPHRLLAKIYKVQGNDTLHGFHLAKAALLAQRNWENQYNLALYQISRGRTAQAEKLLVKTMELNSGFGPAKFEYAKLMLNKGDTETAFRKFDEALMAEPQNSRYLAYSAYAAHITNRPTVSAQNMAEALRITPKNTTVNYLNGLIQYNKGEIAAAEKSLREALRYSPADALALEALGDVLAANFKYKEACANYLTAWHSVGYSESIAYKLGKALTAQNKYKEAKDFFEAVAAKNPQNGEVFFRLIDAYCVLGDIKQALIAQERFAPHRAQSAAWYQLVIARIHEARGEYDYALKAYSAATAFDTNNPHISAGAGRVMFRQGDFAAAIGYFDRAAKGDPANVQPLLAQAKAYENIGKRDEAVSVYESIIARNPQNPDLYLTVSSIKEGQGNTRDAIKTLNKGIEANTGDVTLLFAAGKLYQASKQYELAISTYQTAIGRKAQINSNNIEALRLIGEIYYSKLTDEKKAREFLRKYVRAGGTDSGAEDILKKLSNKQKT